MSAMDKQLQEEFGPPENSELWILARGTPVQKAKLAVDKARQKTYAKAMELGFVVLNHGVDSAQFIAARWGAEEAVMAEIRAWQAWDRAKATSS